MGDYGIKIARSGKGITSTDPLDFHFWSKYRAKSIKYKGQLQITTSSSYMESPVTATYTHDFGYIPQFMVFGTSYDGNYINLDYYTGGTYGKDGELWNEFLEAYATSTTLVISADLNHFIPMMGDWTGIARTYTFDILLFMEQVETS
jgi:hypothetical protein